MAAEKDIITLAVENQIAARVASDSSEAAIIVEIAVPNSLEKQVKHPKEKQHKFYLVSLLLNFFDQPPSASSSYSPSSSTSHSSSPVQVNVTLAGYVTKVLVSLLNLAHNKYKEEEVRKEGCDCLQQLKLYLIFLITNLDYVASR